jgi:tryptophan 7-halogenase
MNKPLKKIIIVGGGTAGWLTAGIIAAEYQLQSTNGLEVILIESPDIPTIGVGEGTWPSMRNTLKKIGVSETDFFRECDASFKQGSKFIGWIKGDSSDHYYHPFTPPEKFSEINLAEHWQSVREKISFADFVSSQSALSDHHLAPKLMSTPEYAGVMNYGYHLDAGKFSLFLKKHCIEKLGVVYVSDNVIKVNSSEMGDIESLTTLQYGNIEGDLFIDCSGFSSLLLGQHFGIPFKNERNVLFNDSALAIQVPYSTVSDPIQSCTLGSAQVSGWIWDIGLPTRRGVGHVYSSAHITDEHAEDCLRHYLSNSLSKSVLNQLSIRKLSFNPGYREKLWYKNCVAVGMAAGFIEPLEATALVLVELSAQMIAEQLPANQEIMHISAKRFNEKFEYRWKKIIDFLKLHYVLSRRADSAYWRDHRLQETIPETLQEQLMTWSYRSPWICDTLHLDEMFPAASYQYVLLGMNHNYQFSVFQKRSIQNEKQKAQEMFNDNDKKTKILRTKLPSNRDLLSQLREYRFQKI